MSSLDTANSLIASAFELQEAGEHIQAVLHFDAAIDMYPECYPQYLKRRFFSVWNGFKQAQDNSDWRHYPRLQELLREGVTQGLWTVGEMALAAPGLSNLDVLAMTSRHGLSVMNSQTDSVPFDFSHHPSQGKIKIGFIGADFFDQATAYLLTDAMSHMDRSQFELYAYDHGPQLLDSFRERAIGAYDTVRPIHERSDEDAAQLIYDDGIEVLFSIKNPASARLGVLARRPAPVQVHYLYFPGTSGMPFLDAFVADNIVVPESLSYGYSEKIWHIEGCYQPNDSQRALPIASQRADLGLPEDAVIMANMSQNYKITPDIYEQWMRVMLCQPCVILWLLCDTPEIQERLRITAARRGVDPARIIFSAPMPTQLHLSRLSIADLIVDTYPYGGHTLTSDALWAGTPVVTMMGDTYASRVAASLLTSVGLTRLITHSYDEYFRTINTLVIDPQRRAEYSKHLTDNRLTFDVFNAKSYAKRFGDMIQKYVRPV